MRRGWSISSYFSLRVMERDEKGSGDGERKEGKRMRDSNCGGRRRRGEELVGKITWLGESMDDSPLINIIYGMEIFDLYLRGKIVQLVSLRSRASMVNKSRTSIGIYATCILGQRYDRG